MPKIIPPIYFYNAIIVAPRRIRFKSIPQSCSPKLLPKAAPPKLRSKANPQSCGFSKQSNCSVNAAAKPQSCSPQLFPKAALQNVYRKPRPKEVLQTSACRLRKQAPYVRQKAGAASRTSRRGACQKEHRDNIAQKLGFVQTKNVFGQKSKIIDLFSEQPNRARAVQS